MSSEEEARRVAASMKSDVGPAILVFCLYLLFYLPGLVANIAYLSDAKKMQRLAGRGLPGTGILEAELILAIVFGVFLVLVMVVVVGGFLSAVGAL